MAYFVIKILLNFVFVLGCMLIFIAPFYYMYRRTHVSEEGVKTNLSRHLENFFLSKYANYLLFFWAFGEALFWFVIPEFFLLLIVFMRIRRKKQLLFYDVAGTVAGTLVAFLFHFSNATVSNLPYIQPAMVEQTISWYDKLGVFGLIYQPFSGVPYKVFTLTAHNYEFFLPLFILVAVVVRMSRYIIFFGIFLALYPGLHNFVYKHYVRLFLVATFIFSVLLLKVVSNYDESRKIVYIHQPSVLLLRR